MVFEVIEKSAAARTDEPVLRGPTAGVPTVNETAVTDRRGADPTVTEPHAGGARDTRPVVTGRAVGDPRPEGAPSESLSLEEVSQGEVSQGEVSQGEAAAGGTAVPARRPVPRGVICQLLRSAVSLQAEGVLRTAGALAGAWGGVLDRTEWIERDARDLSVLAAAAVAADVPLPAGVDTGAADPAHPGSVVESLLVGHEALVRVLRQLDDAPVDSAPGDRSQVWRGVVRGILSRREEEILLLRAVGACGDLPPDERYLRGRPPRP